MMRAWLGIALLAASWLLGLGYYHETDGLAWAILAAAGSALLAGTVRRLPGRAAGGLAVLLVLPAAWLMPWPYRAAPLLIAFGVALHCLPVPRRWPGAVGRAAAAAGAVLLAQALAMLAYASFTARSHELPWPLPSLLGLVARLLDIPVGVDGSSLALWSMRQVNPVGATWELLLDPPTLCFLAGGLVLLALRAWAGLPQGTRLLHFRNAAAALAVSVAVWLPVRAGLQMAFFLHRLLRTDYDSRLDLMGQFWSPWVHLVLLAVPVLLAWRFAAPIPGDGHPPAAEEAEAVDGPAPRKWQRPAAAALAGAAIAALTLAAVWDPAGTRKSGRVAFDEHHSTWEPTERPYDTTWYGHDSGYNYACIYDYCSRFYEMSRLAWEIDDNALSNCDVLIVKVPTSPYTPAEVAAIARFVERGGGLLLIGEHTDVFGTGRNINAVAREFGLEFRYDCCFGVDSVFDERYPPALVPHPIVQHMPPFDFAISCSIAPGASAGRIAILGTGLKNLPADYHASNFYPQAQDRPDMRYGAFVQLWATRRGAGRVVAFSDSTVFSNFSTFEPGKAELMLGMVEWLNHRNTYNYSRTLLVVLGLGLLAGGLFLARGWDSAWLALLAAGMLGWAAAVAGAREAHRAAIPLPKAVRPMVRVTIDRTLSDATLSKSGFIGGKPDGFGIFERWVLRLGYFTARRSGTDALQGDLVVFLHPERPPSEEFRDALVRYVADGGKVLILDSPDSAKSSANSLLWPFGLALNRNTRDKGLVKAPAEWPSFAVESACEVTGGAPFVTLSGRPVAATARHGKGTVTVIGFGSRFTDPQMGVTGDVVPSPDLRKVYDFQFALLRAIVGG